VRGWVHTGAGIMVTDFDASYLSLSKTGELEARAQALYDSLRECRLCPRECGADRLSGEEGVCRTGRLAKVSSASPHFGEEAPLVGSAGSGTIFFSGCNLQCRFCQNYEISQVGDGRELTCEELAGLMLRLQELGCHNVNLVSPTHVVAQVVKALSIAALAGLRVPIVYNTGGYDSVETLGKLEGIVDIYMPDMKYGSDEAGKDYSGIDGYARINRAAVAEMHRQVGDLVVDERGVAKRGLLVRHLVLPNGIAGSEETISFIASEVSKNTYLNIMSQYRPCYLAGRYPELSRRPTVGEMQSVFRLARQAGLNRLDEKKGFLFL